MLRYAELAHNQFQWDIKTEGAKHTKVKSYGMDCHILNSLYTCLKRWTKIQGGPHMWSPFLGAHSPRGARDERIKTHKSRVWRLLYKKEKKVTSLPLPTQTTTPFPHFLNFPSLSLPSTPPNTKCSPFHSSVCRRSSSLFLLPPSPISTS